MNKQELQEALLEFAECLEQASFRQSTRLAKWKDDFAPDTKPYIKIGDRLDSALDSYRVFAEFKEILQEKWRITEND